MSAPTLLVVCTGNVCRSPLVERVLQHHLDGAHGAGTIRVHSAGTGALVGSPMDERSAALLRDLGGDPGGFAARRLTSGMVAEADLVLTATRAHRADVVRLVPRAMRRTFTVRELALLLTQVPDTDLPDWRDPAPALATLADLARSARGVVVAGRDEELDVVDPYRRDDEVYAQVRDQVERALPDLLRGFTGGRAAT